MSGSICQREVSLSLSLSLSLFFSLSPSLLLRNGCFTPALTSLDTYTYTQMWTEGKLAISMVTTSLKQSRTLSTDPLGYTTSCISLLSFFFPHPFTFSLASPSDPDSYFSILCSTSILDPVPRMKLTNIAGTRFLLAPNKRATSWKKGKWKCTLGDDIQMQLP